MNLGDVVVVDKTGHPFNGLQGTIIGRRGNRAPGDPIYLVYIKRRSRSFLIPESMLRVEEEYQTNGSNNWPI